MHRYAQLLDRAKALSRVTQDDERLHWHSEVVRLERLLSVLRYMGRG